MNGSFRSKLLWLHTWSGLTIGLVAVFLGVTGAIFVLRPQLERLLHRELFLVPACAQRIALDALTASALEAHPGGTLESLEIHADTRASIAVKFTNDDYVYLDPCTGGVLGMQNAYGGVFGTADRLHRFWFMDKTTGKRIAGWATALFSVVLIIGGITLWWPRSMLSLKGALQFNPRLPGSARTISLHKAAGLYSSLVLLALALTALPISFPPIKSAIYSATGYVKPPEPRSAAPAGAQRVPMQALWRTSRSLVPDWEWMSFGYAHQPADPVEVQILERGSPHKNAKSHLYLDAYTGAALSLSHYATDVGLGRKIYLYCVALHAGLVWGLPYQLLLLVASLAMPLLAYSGFSTYLRRKLRKPARTHVVLRLLGKRTEAPDICSFELAARDGKPLPPFTAGAHIEVKLRDGMTRQYSLCNDPQETHRYVIAVLRHPLSRGGSRAMHDGLAVGDLLEVGMPRNLFALTFAARRSVLIGGGIGVTPILSMAETLAARGSDFSMHYCVRSRSNAAFLDRIRQSSFADRVTIHASDAGERLDIASLLDTCDRTTHFYACGPQRLMDELSATAKQKGWPDAHMHREYFSGAVHSSAADIPFDVRINRTGQIIRVAADKSIVAALADCAIHIPTSCAEGVCGTCITRVVDGEVEHRDVFLTAEQRARNEWLTPCCSRARSGILTLDL